ncbi:hypothetical protein TeGR_g13780 [Tetraparma gracilis]|jgi:hypothetical protein|uniref:Uncharacterized protein n=1 Tax=Tetraparma gracilis TaxID=2962635 RepID=A0ABQ6N987_9STRA|nr:hypothetical protein TeGR_g13780 [Tetraparma gracilis]
MGKKKTKPQRPQMSDDDRALMEHHAILQKEEEKAYLKEVALESQAEKKASKAAARPPTRRRANYVSDLTMDTEQDLSYNTYEGHTKTFWGAEDSVQGITGWLFGTVVDKLDSRKFLLPAFPPSLSLSTPQLLLLLLLLLAPAALLLATAPSPWVTNQPRCSSSLFSAGSCSRTGATKPFLLVGALSSGVKPFQSVASSSLSLPVGDESSNSELHAASAGTASVSHSLVFFPRGNSPRLLKEKIKHICRQNWAGDFGFHPSHFVQTKCDPHIEWDKCWQFECEQVLLSNWGCALSDEEWSPEGRWNGRCSTPFEKKLLLARNPIDTITDVWIRYCSSVDHYRKHWMVRC